MQCYTPPGKKENEVFCFVLSAFERSDPSFSLINQDVLTRGLKGSGNQRGIKEADFSLTRRERIMKRSGLGR